MLHFTTYFDKNYLSRGIILYDSLKQYCNDFELYILCLDDFTENYFKLNKQSYPEVRTLLQADIEAADVELKAAKENRNTIEYYFTLSPCLPLYLLKKYNLSHICSLDADILFLSDPHLLFNYLNEYSIIITPHKFSPEIKAHEQFGEYNVSFQIFKNDGTGISCLENWRKQCIEWCDDTYDEINERFADQKYLDAWMQNYPGKVKELFDNVSGLAPWNLNNFLIEKRDNFYYSNGERIIFYHFHHFKTLTKEIATNGFYFYRAKRNKAIDHLYLEYWNKLSVLNKVSGNYKDEIKRTHLADTSSLTSKLNNEGAAYVRLSKKIIRYVDFQTLFGKIVKFIIIKNA
jgi:hypothetical protein